jgi:ubiquinone/menaquinone biosynthesis C-methylase UbiE
VNQLPATDFVELTEVAGEEVSVEQVERMARRYYWAADYWAADYCSGKDVLEVACGTGQGLGWIAGHAKSVAAGDYSMPLLQRAKAHYRSRYPLLRLDAQRLPFHDASFDVVVLFEALYYIPNAELFYDECRRVLRPGGVLLVATANKDLFDFTPSPHSFRYYGVSDLARELGARGFTTTFFGDTPVGEVSARQKVLRPIKAAVSKLGLMPKSMSGKKLLKRLVFGTLVPMPAEITGDSAARLAPQPLPAEPDRRFKVILCAASRQ